MKNRASSLLWGVLFIIAGIGFVGNALNIWNFSLFFDGWWTLFIIIPSAMSIIQSRPRPLPISAFIIGVLLLLSCRGWFDFVAIEKLIVPIILIVVGLSIIIRNFGVGIDKRLIDGVKEPCGEYHGIFAGQEVVFNENEVFEGCTMNAIFGSVTLDLRSCIVNEDVSIDCSVIFGGIDIYVPGDVNIKVSSTPIFGGVGNKGGKRAYVQGAPTVYINAVCMFGGVEIK